MRTLLFMLALSACSQTFNEDRAYREVTDSEASEGCEGCGPGDLHLCANGSAYYVPGDTVERSSYRIVGDKVLVIGPDKNELEWAMEGDNLVSSFGVTWSADGSAYHCK